MRSPWKLLALVEAIALIALFVLWPEKPPAAGPATNPSIQINAGSVASEEPGPLGGIGPQAGSVSRVEVENDADIVETPVSTILAGQIRDDSGAAVTSGWIALIPETGNNLNVRIESSGGYAVHAIPPGVCTVRIAGKDCYTYEEELDLSRPRPVLRKDFTVQRAISYKVRLETMGGEELFQWLAAETSNRKLYEALTVVVTNDSEATFEPTGSRTISTPGANFRRRGRGTPAELPTRWSGVLTLSEPLPKTAHVAMNHVVLQSAPLPPATDELVIQVDENRLIGTLCTVRLRVVDARTGAPVAGAKIAMNDRQSHSFGGEPTGEDGRAELTEVRPGLLEVGIITEGYASYDSRIRLQPGSVVDLGDLAIGPAVQVAFRVKLPSGEPAARVTARCYLPERLRFVADPIGLGIGVDVDGLLRVVSAPAGPVVLILGDGKDLALQAFRVEVPNEFEAPPVLRLRDGPVVSFQIDGPGATRSRHYLFDENGVQLGRGLRAGFREMALPSGRYRIESVTPSGEHLATTDFRVGIDATMVEVHVR